MRHTSRTSGHSNLLLRAGGAIAAVLVLSAVAWVPAASAAPVGAGVSISSTGTGTVIPEDHVPQGVRNPGDDLSLTDQFVRTLDATRVNLTYLPDIQNGSTNLKLTATIVAQGHAGWDLRGTNFAGGLYPPCPGGITTPQRNVLECDVGTTNATTPTNFFPVMRVSAAAGDGFAFHVEVKVEDANSTDTAVSTNVISSAAPRFDLEKTINSPTQTASTMMNEGLYLLKIGDADPLGISALASPVTFTDHVDQKSRITSCNDTTPDTVLNLPLTSPDQQLFQVTGSTCNTVPFTPTAAAITGLGNGQQNDVTMPNVDWERIYPPPTISNGISDGVSGYAVAMMQYYMETDKTDIELGDGVANNGVGDLRVGNAIGMGGYDSNTDSGTGGSAWNPVDIQGSPNLGSDSNQGEDDTTDNTATYLHNIYIDARHGKYVSELTVDGQHVTTTIAANDASQGGVSWPTEIDLCDKFDNRRQQIARAPNSTEAVVNLTAPNAPAFASASVQYGRSAGWGPNAGSTGTQWWNMSHSECRAADVAGGTFYNAGQVDWNNGGGNLIDARDINMVRYLPNGPYQPQGGGLASYYIDVHFQVADNNAGDYIVDYSSADLDGPNGPGTWELSSCTGGSSGTCPDPPELNFDQGHYRPGPTSSGMMIHVDSHPTIAKRVTDPPTASGTSPVQFTYELDLGNTRVAGNTTPRQAFTVTDQLPPELRYVQGSYSVISNTAGLGISGPTVTPSINGEVISWTFTGLTLDVLPAHMPVIQYRAEADIFTPSGAYVNRATITGPGILPSLTTPWSSTQITPAQFLGLSSVGIDGLNHSRWGLFDEAEVEVNGQGGVVMLKDVDRPTSEPGDVVQYSLIYGNPADDVERMDGYDILPFDGDGRGSGMHGDLELLSVTEDPNSDVEIWISDTSPATLDALDQTLPVGTGSAVAGGINPSWPGLPGTGSATWPCEIGQAGTPGCPALSAVTAIRIVGADPNPGASGPTDSFLPTGAGPFIVEVAVRSVDGRGGDVFHNNWSGDYAPLDVPTQAEAPAHSLTEGAVGDRVFEDVNENGIFDSGDHGLANVTVDVFDSANTVVGSDQTDANGRWLVDHLHPDDYRIRISSTEFDPGGPLEHFEAAAGGAPDPDANVDEAGDHDAHAVMNGIEAGDRVTISYGQEPLMDDIGQLTFLRDSDSNLTVDFALTEIVDPPPPPPPHTPLPPVTTTTTTPGGPPKEADPPRRSLPRTGWESLLWILIGGSLIIGGTMVVSRRQDRRA